MIMIIISLRLIYMENNAELSARLVCSSTAYTLSVMYSSLYAQGLHNGRKCPNRYTFSCSKHTAAATYFQLLSMT
jgi:hypothetical protein